MLIMPKHTWIIATLLSVVVVGALIGWTAWQQGQELDRSRKALEEVRAQAEQNRQQTMLLTNELAGAQARIDELLRENQAATQAQHGLEQEMRSALESKDVTISQLQGKLTVNILDHILFDSGEAVLKAEGEQVLRKIANVLAQHPALKIHVIGHTDNVPIRASARDRFPSNWELSTARATAAVRFLCEQGGVAPLRVGAVGYGEYRPVADNNTAEGRAQNRRIAIVVLSDELVGADVVPTTNRVALTASPSMISPSNPPPASIAATNPPLVEMTNAPAQTNNPQGETPAKP